MTQSTPTSFAKARYRSIWAGSSSVFPTFASTSARHSLLPFVTTINPSGLSPLLSFSLAKTISVKVSIFALVPIF